MSGSYSIVIAEDEKAIRSIMKMVFEANDFSVFSAENGSETMMLITSRCPDVVILDLGLPDMDGMKVIQNVREFSEIPIIVVSARSHEREKINALEAGADDYITKPFGTGELLARVRTALRHSQIMKNSLSESVADTYKIGELEVDFKKRKAYINGEDVHLTQNEFKIVSILAKNAGKIITYDVLIKNIWGPYMENDNQILRVNMANIRRKIEKDTANPEYIVTEIGIGYRMNTD